MDESDAIDAVKDNTVVVDGWPGFEVKAVEFDVEFMRCDEVCRIYAVSRATLYEKMRDGQISFVSLRKPGAVNGIRLLRAASVREYFEGAAKKEGGGIQGEGVGGDYEGTKLYLDLEFMRCGQVAKIYGVAKSTIYDLMRRGKVGYVTIRKRGSSRGFRLLKVASVRAYFDGLVSDADVEPNE